MNEFVVKNGIIVNGNASVSGSIICNSISASLQGTSSWANNSVTSSFALTSPATTIITSSTYQITSSWSNNSISSSYSVTSSFALTSPATTLTTGSTYQITSSWSTKTITSSFALTSPATTLTTASTYQVTSSWANNSISSSYALTSSFTLNGASGGGTTLFTASIYQITSSWSNNSISTSYISGSNAIVTNFTSSNISSSYIQTVNPVDAQQVATKNYVDNFAEFGVDYYFRSASSDIGGYNSMFTLATPLSASATVLTASAVSSSQYIFNFASPAINITNIEQGNIDVNFRAYYSGIGALVSILEELYIRSASVETLLGTSQIRNLTVNSSDSFINAIPITSSTVTNLTDRFVLKFKVSSATLTPNVFLTIENATAAGITIPVPSVNFVSKTGDTMTGPLTATGFTGSLNGSVIILNDSSSNAIEVFQNINNFTEINIQNTNIQPNASADLVATNNSGSSGTYYTDVGINNSGYTASFVGQANDGYLYTTGSDLYVGNVTVNKSLYLFAGGSNNTSSFTLKPSGMVGIGTISPNNSLDVVGNISCSAITSSTHIGTSSWANNSVTSSIVYGILSGSVPAWKEGILYYDTASHTFTYYNDDPNLSLNIGQESYIRVYNSGSDMSNYISNSAAVYLSGSVNGYPLAWLAIADGSGNKFNVAGVATDNIPTQSYGYITEFGVVHSISAFGFQQGANLWLSTTSSGSYQTTIPTGTSEKVNVGICLISSSTAGQMLVDIKPNAFGAQSSSVSLTSSFALTSPATTLTTASTYQITSSWSNISLLSNFSISSSWASASIFSISSSFASSSLTASFISTASWASNARTASNGAFAWASIWYTGGTMTSQSYNCNVTRSTTGLYSVSFNNNAASSQYAVIPSGFSGSSGGGTNFTSSLISAINTRNNGFTMSIQRVFTGSLIVSDFTTASLIVFSYF